MPLSSWHTAMHSPALSSAVAASRMRGREAEAH